jgi:hypothetical protein
MSPSTVRIVLSKSLRCGGPVITVEDTSNAYRILVQEPLGKQPFRFPKIKWEANVKIDLREIDFEDRK